MSLRQRPELLTTLQAARGAAALAVVLCHVSTLLGPQLHYEPLGGALRAGHAGVDFFFVLSGFIIATVHRGDLGNASMLPGYTWKRLVRIYPIYWAATWVGLALMPLAGANGAAAMFANLEPQRLMESLLLLPQHEAPILGVAWTLSHELLFYGIFGLLILNKSAGAIAFAIWLSFIAVMVPLAPFELPWAHANLLTGFVGSSYNLQFGLGVAVAVLVAKDLVPCPTVLAAVGVAGVLLTSAAEDSNKIAYLGQTGQALFGGSAALVVAGLAAAERSGTLRAGRLLVLVGSASYSIYLVHVPVLTITASVAVVQVLPVWFDVAVLTAVGMAAGLALHLVVERPVLRSLRELRWTKAVGPVSPRT